LKDKEKDKEEENRKEREYREKEIEIGVLKEKMIETGTMMKCDNSLYVCFAINLF
jgi:hypothetical protein